MDSHLRGLLSSSNGIQLGNQSFSVLSNQNLVAGPKFENAFLDHNFRESHYLQPDETLSYIALSLSEAQGDDSLENCDFSDTVLGVYKSDSYGRRHEE